MPSKHATSLVKVGGCTEDKKKECEKKSKICNPITGRCISKTGITYKKSLKENKTQPKDKINKQKTPSPVQKQEAIIETKKTIHDFIKELKKYKTAKEAIEKIFKDDDGDKVAAQIDNTKSKQGFIYEL